MMDAALVRPRETGNRKAPPWMIVVGGFLGAGKTTLLLAAAKELERRGLRSAVMLNDQSEGLVDTEYASLTAYRPARSPEAAFAAVFPIWWACWTSCARMGPM